MSAPTTATAVANEFLALGRQEGILIDQMKLQKLAYYAHAWHLAEKGEPLFDEEVEAWPWGPVVRALYLETSKYGRHPIDGELTDLEPNGPDIMDWTFKTPRIDDDGTKHFVQRVWEVHKAYSGVQLSNSTHAPGEPWTIVRDQYGSLDSKPVIPNKLIQAIFKKKIDDDAGDTAA